MHAVCAEGFGQHWVIADEKLPVLLLGEGAQGGPVFGLPEMPINHGATFRQSRDHI